MINDKFHYKNMQLVMFSLAKPLKMINSIRGKIEPFAEAIQYICQI